MKQILLLVSVMSLFTLTAYCNTTYTTTLSKVATTDTMYSYTYRNDTQVCAIDIFVPAKGKIKVEKICYNLK